MSDGTITMPGRASAPGAPSLGKFKLYIDATTNKPFLIDSNGDTISFGSNFGSQFFKAKRSTVQSNTVSNSFVSYLDMPVTGLDSGAEYRIFISCKFRSANTGFDIRARLVAGGVQLGEEFRGEQQDAGADQRGSANFLYHTDPGELTGDQTLSLEFAPSAGFSAELHYAEIEFWRTK